MRTVLFLSLFSITVFANEIKELIDIALQNNSNILIQKSNIKSKEASIQESKSAYLPTLSLSADATNYEIESLGAKSNGDAKGYTLSANQLIYDFGKTTGAITASKKSYQASLKELVTTTSKTVLDVKKAYFDILSKYHLIEVAKESIKIDSLQLKQAEAYLNAGIKTRIDVTNAQLQLSNSRLDLVKANYSYKKAQTKLISILGERSPLDINPKNEDILTLTKNIKTEGLNLQELQEKALNSRAEIDVYKSLLEASQAQYKASSANYYPTLNLSGAYKDSDSEDIASLDSTQGSIGVFLKWEFFSGFRTVAKNKQAFSSIVTSREQLKQQELNIIEELSAAYYNVRESFEAIDISLLTLDLAKQNLSLAQERYKNGLNDIVELNNAKLDFITSKNDLVNSYYTYKTSKATLEYSTGVIYEN